MSYPPGKVTSRIALLCGLLSLITPGFAAQESRIRGVVKNVGAEGAGAVVLRGNVTRSALPEHDQGALDLSAPIHGMRLILGQTTEQAAALEQLLEDQRNPSSPDYQRWLTPEEYGERFGVSDNDLAQLATWLQSQGFTVEQVARAHNWIAFSGTAGQVRDAFRTELHHFEADGKRHFANATEPLIPASLAGVVDSIRGLDDFRPEPQPQTFKAIPDFNASNGFHYIGPADLATIYDIQALYSAGFDGTGQKLVIAGQTDINLSDIRAFRAQFALPAKDPQLVLVGSDPGKSQSDQIEANLDLEWAGAVARNATIIYVYSQNVFESLEYAIDQNLAPVISVSYGGCETAATSSFRTLAQQANAEGITWLNASGDSGAAGCDNDGERAASQGPAVTFPADIPEVTAVGGSELNEGSVNYWSPQNGSGLKSALSYIPEEAWNDTAQGYGLASGGGGASTLYTKPWWQTGPGVPNDQARDVPDVSLTASGDHDGYVIYSGGLISVGGTSASSPSFAGIVAILNQYLMAKGALAKPGLGNINPSLYSLAANTTALFHDITKGNNVVPCALGSKGCGSGSFGYAAGPGYDLATGLGSVDAYNLVTGWTSLAPSVGTKATLTASPTAIASAGSTTLTASITAVSGSNPPTGSVAFSLGGNPVGLGSSDERCFRKRHRDTHRHREQPGRWKQRDHSQLYARGKLQHLDSIRNRNGVGRLYRHFDRSDPKPRRYHAEQFYGLDRRRETVRRDRLSQRHRDIRRRQDSPWAGELDGVSRRCDRDPYCQRFEAVHWTQHHHATYAATGDFSGSGGAAIVTVTPTPVATRTTVIASSQGCHKRGRQF